MLQLGSEGKRLRPTILLLMASSLSAAVPPATTLEVDLRPPATHITDHRRRQQRIAEVFDHNTVDQNQTVHLSDRSCSS
jgi:geranylgeranyl pyrophosphate synthase